MKKLIFATLVALSATTAFAQSPAPAKAQFRQAAELAVEALNGFAGADYIAGCRINPYLFVGAGAGVHYYFGKAGETALDTAAEKQLKPCAVNVPLYANIKAYLLKDRRCTPYVSLSAGARLSGSRTARMIMGDAKYNTCAMIIDASIGAEYRLDDNYSIYVSVGSGVQGMPYAQNITSYSFDKTTKYKPDLNIRIGFSF